MPIKKSELYGSIWKSCDELRGGMDASQYKDYVLVLLFVKYVSDKYAGKKDALIEVPKGGGSPIWWRVLGCHNSERQNGCMSESRPLSAPTEWWQPYVADCGPEKPSRLSQVLAETIPVEPRTKKLLDIGCGTGIIGLYCLLEKKARFVTFVDLMPEWIHITRANARLKIEKRAITPSQVDVMDAMPFARIPPEVVAQHDMLIFNLPQYPEDYANPSDLSKFEADPIKAHYRLAGPDGLKLARDFSQWYARLKQPKPDAVFVLWSILGKRQIIKALTADRFQWKIIKETPVPVKPEFSRVAAQFFQDTEERDNRMLERNEDGWTNKVLTIRLTNI
jgi:methylase of polypeptide subunit release factors